MSETPESPEVFIHGVRETGQGWVKDAETAARIRAEIIAKHGGLPPAGTPDRETVDYLAELIEQVRNHLDTLIDAIESDTEDES